MKIKNLVCASLLSTTLLASTVFAGNTAVITADSVNVRDGASASSNIIKSYDKNKEFEVTGIINNFYSFTDENRTRYVSADFAKVAKADGVVTGNGVFLRNEASATAPTCGMLAVDTKVVVVGQTDGWYQVEANDSLAFVSKDFISGDFIDSVGAPKVIEAPKTNVSNIVADTAKFVKVNASGGLNLRSDASETSSVLIVVPNGSTHKVIEEKNGFTKVSYNGKIGFIKTSYTSVFDPNAPVTVSTGGTGADIVAWAKQYIGTPYVYGGTSLTGGVDCSGFTTAVFRDNPYQKVSINRVASDQYNNGTRVAKADLLPGDLVLFDTSGANNGVITHAGIYAGNGQFIHSSSGSRKGIVMSDLTSGFYLNAYVGGTRILK